MKLQVWVAALALFVLGVLYGWQSTREVGGECEFAPRVNGEVESVHKIEAQRIQYVVTSDDTCRLLVFASRFPAYQTGDQLTVVGEVEYVRDFPPELAGYGAYLARRGITATLRYPTVQRIQPGKKFFDIRESLSRRVMQLFPEPEASAVLAMVLGQAGTMPEEVIQDFRTTGVSHILAISGMNLSLLTVLIWGVSFLIPLPRMVRTLAVLVLLWFYVWLIIFPVSAVRAAWFWTFALVALQLRRLVGLPTIFVLAVLTMVSVNPQIIADVGFQLSVSAVAGMWLAAFVTSTWRPRRLPTWLTLTALATGGATLTTWPIVAYHFGIISFISALANILIVPTVGPFMVIALLALAAQFLAPPVALIISLPVHLLWRWMTAVANILARFPGAALTDVSVPVWFLPVYYVAGFVLVVLVLRHQHRTWREIWI